MDVERIEKLLALQLMHDMQDAPQSERASALNKAGFSNAEIASFLGTTSGVIAQQLYTQRSGKKKKKKKKK